MFARLPTLLTALALLTAALVGGCGGSGKADPIAEATKAAGTPAAASLTLVAKGVKWDQRVLVAAAATDLNVRLDNQDTGVQHNFSLYTDRSAAEKIYAGPLFSDKKVVDNRFRAPAAGIYFYRCDVHPDTMTGTFITK